MKVIINQSRIEVKNVWGGQRCITHATATVIYTVYNLESREDYEIEFSRDQISGRVDSVTCLDRKEETTTENTLQTKIVEELCYDKLSDC